MAKTYGNADFIRLEENKQPTSIAEADNSVYGNSDELDWNLKTKDFADNKEREKSYKGVVADLCIFLLTAMVALCVLGSLYSNQLRSYNSVKEQYSIVAANLIAQEQNATEMEKSYRELKAKHDTTKGCLSSCSQCSDKTFKRKKYYYFSSDKLNWMQSRDYCVETGGQLVIKKSIDDQVYLTSNLRETHWIGLHDLHTEGHWMWVDNTTLSGETFWYTRSDEHNEPDNWKHENPAGENCASLGSESGGTAWFDASCSKLKKFICEK
ncbi:CD209 antigen-like protein D isoform X2 [Myxocyprinus asiaticus]|uniref:CD209 antigen-like protein D isoform X2 n=1 Tax=Myxocyprinus asiaticus TaxID=70543 RepID=UPI002222C846|nr:CD209 antigen-like protein D isoform X2 [Myxocyprinus asiaticus]